MQTLNKTTTITFNAIVEGMGPENTYKKIDNTDSTLMPLVVERLYETNLGPVFSLAHYFEQNGDLCQDPEMLFIKHTKSGQVIPTMLKNLWCKTKMGNGEFEQNCKLNIPVLPICG